MWSDGGTITFSTSEAFPGAMGSVRAALRRQGLRIIAELDISRRTQKTLGITLPPCRVLFVWPGTAAVAEVFPAAAVFLPIHVVVAAKRSRTEIILIPEIDIGTGEIDPFVRRAVLRTQADTVLCLEAIYARVSLI